LYLKSKSAACTAGPTDFSQGGYCGSDTAQEVIEGRAVAPRWSTYRLEGSLEDAEGRCGAGDFVWRPGGNIHVAHVPDGAMFISIFNRPNRFFDGTKFFTTGGEGGAE
jgi:hypothetical protein